MKVVHFLFIVFILFATAQASFAQFRYPKPQYVEELKKRTVVVALFNEKTEVEKLANEYIKKYFAEYWKLTPVEFRGIDEVVKLFDSNDQRYAIIVHESGDHDMEGVRRMRNGVRESKPTVVATLSFYAITLYLVTDNEELLDPVFQVTFVHSLLQPVDYVFALQQFNNHLLSVDQGLTSKEFFPIKENLEILKTRTLMLERGFMEVEEDEIGEVYKHPYTVFSSDTFNNKILETEEGFVYPKLIWAPAGPAYMFAVTDAATGKIYSLVALGGVNRTKFGTTRPSYYVDRVHLKYFGSEFANKINSRY
jgi:hypothetical protein